MGENNNRPVRIAISILKQKATKLVAFLVGGRGQNPNRLVNENLYHSIIQYMDDLGRVFIFFYNLMRSIR